MITAVFLEDAYSFGNLAPISEWKRFVNNEYYAIGSLNRTKNGNAAAGIMLYEIKKLPGNEEQKEIYIRWVYASRITKDTESVYDELFDEIEAVAFRLGISRIFINVLVNKDYNFEELFHIVCKHNYISSLGYNMDINAVKNV
ncbi:MAG: hypothetical protein K6B41_08125 [Butyrivibrio sp.]|nr:hypothetical protein [Butyrivibrio sp.]